MNRERLAIRNMAMKSFMHKCMILLILIHMLLGSVKINERFIFTNYESFMIIVKNQFNDRKLFVLDEK